MPKRHTIDEIRKIIDDKFDNDISLLSNVYINNREPMLFQCKCGNTFEKSFQAINAGSIRCKECSNLERSNSLKDGFDSIIKTIEDNNCKYISGEYINNKSKLLLQCSCGNMFEKDMSHFKSGQTTCNNCSLNRTKQSITKSFEQVIRDIESGGCEYISGDYDNVESILTLKCKCGNIFQKSLHKYNSGQNRCPECGAKSSIELRRKYIIEESPFMNINNDIRQSKELTHWKSDVSKLYNNKCPITNETTDLDVHHLISFSSIFYNTARKYIKDISLYDNIIKIPSIEDYNKIKNIVFKKHIPEIGILISHKIHLDFHSKYGYLNNTPEQFNEFLKDNYNTSLDKITNR